MTGKQAEKNVYRTPATPHATSWGAQLVSCIDVCTHTHTPVLAMFFKVQQNSCRAYI